MYLTEKLNILSLEEKKFLASMIRMNQTIVGPYAVVENLGLYSVSAAVDSIDYCRYYLNEAGNKLATAIHNKLVK